MGKPDGLEGEFTSKDVVRVIFLCVAWYSLSSANNIIVKTLLNDFPYPMTVTMVQLLSIWVYLQPVLRFWRIPPLDTARVPWRYYFTMIFPLALGKFITSVSAHVSLWRITVSYAHTGKSNTLSLSLDRELMRFPALIIINRITSNS